MLSIIASQASVSNAPIASTVPSQHIDAQNHQALLWSLSFDSSLDLELRLDAAAQLADVCGDRDLNDRLLPLLDAPSATTRRCAATAIGFSGNLAAIFPLFGLLDDADQGVRESALMALAAIRDPRVLSFVLGALERDTSLLRTALEALRLLPSELTAPIYQNYLDHPDPEIALLALGAFQFVDDVVAADLACSQLPSPDPRRRLLALQILENWGRRRDLEAILPLLSDRDARVKRLARQCINSIRAQAKAIVQA